MQRKRGRWLMIAAGVLLWWLLSLNVRGAEVDVTIQKTPSEIVVENPWPKDTPTVYIVGLPDRERSPVALTKGVTLNGVRMTERLLSESVLILYPDGTGKWGYHAGFDIFREPDIRDGRRIDARTLVEYDKWQYDPLGPVSVVGGDMTLLRLFHGRPYPPLLHEIAFADPIKIKNLTISTNCDQIAQPGTEIRVRLYADPERRQMIAEQKRGGERGRFPVTFDDIDRSRVIVEISASAPEDNWVYLYWTFLEADLDTGSLELPALEHGRNVIRVGDDPGSSHRARIVLRWFEKPSEDRIWDDFEGELRWSGCRPVESSRDEGLSFTGDGFARINFLATGKDHMLWRGFPEPLDLTGSNRLGIASRVRQGAPMVAILFGIQNGKGTGYQYVWLRPRRRWHFQTFDIGGFARDNVTAFNVYFTAVKGYDHPEVTCEYDIDSLCLYYEEPEPKKPRPLPDHVANYRSPYAGAEAHERPIPPIQEWFPMGFYDGIVTRPKQEVVYLLDQMKRHQMNAVYVSNGTLEGLERVLPLAEARGIRLIYQGGGAGALYYLHYPTEEARVHVLNGQILPRARERVPAYKGRWGLAAWSLTEEITPEMSRELAPFYDLVRELDPTHPPTVLHNNLEAAKVDLETNHPPVVTHDFYPFFWSPRSGPSNPRRSLAAYRQHVSSYYKACRTHGASLWMMPQAWGGGFAAPLDAPNYGYRVGMRQPEPGEIKQQGWLAIAEGATGIMFFAAVASNPDHHHLWDYPWKETANTRAAGELFENVRRVAPLLCRLERDYREEGFVKVLKGKAIAHSFVKRKGYPGSARYVVLASLDGFEPQNVSLGIVSDQQVFDLIARREVTGRPGDISLGAGEGTVLLVGSREELRADCEMIDEQLDTYYVP